MMTLVAFLRVKPHLTLYVKAGGIPRKLAELDKDEEYFAQAKSK
jgi:hypothetical protein